jgi:hypothetical protein
MLCPINIGRFGPIASERDIGRDHSKVPERNVIRYLAVCSVTSHTPSTQTST